MRIGAAVLGFAAACSFSHGSLTQPDPDATAVDSSSTDAAIDARPDARPDSPPAQPVTATFADVADTYTDSANPTTAFGGTASMYADGSTTPATALVRFDLSAIPTTAVVQSAVLHVWVSNDIGAAVQVYQMLEGWDELTATWNQRMTNTAWTGAGASPPSRGTTMLASFTPDAFYAEKTGTIASSVVQSWVTTPALNYGFAITTQDADGSAWRTRENTTIENHPILVVTYVPQ
ncbi:MAG TPA: DNRLRE domain-containing protein [Kofleriaceae bacterium]|nr:DNRLRE domain-containing protein [Kofleriaceae bacterium]